MFTNLSLVIVSIENEKTTIEPVKVPLLVLQDSLAIVASDMGKVGYEIPTKVVTYVDLRVLSIKLVAKS